MIIVIILDYSYALSTLNMVGLLFKSDGSDRPVICINSDFSNDLIALADSDILIG